MTQKFSSTNLDLWPKTKCDSSVVKICQVYDCERFCFLDSRFWRQNSFFFVVTIPTIKFWAQSWRLITIKFLLLSWRFATIKLLFLSWRFPRQDSLHSREDSPRFLFLPWRFSRRGTFGEKLFREEKQCASSANTWKLVVSKQFCIPFVSMCVPHSFGLCVYQVDAQTMFLFVHDSSNWVLVVIIFFE